LAGEFRDRSPARFQAAADSAGGRRPLGELTVFVIVATVLQAVVMGWGVWLFDGLRRDLALNEEVTPWDEAWVEPLLKTGGEGAGEGEPVDEAEAARRSEYQRAMRLIEHVRLRRAFIVSALVMLVLELAAFILWQVRAHSNVPALGSLGLRYGSTSSVVWWFVPIAVLWKPLGVVHEI